MKKADILVGKIYGDGKGNERKVIAAGAEYKLYGAQAETDCVRFKVVRKGRSPMTLGEEGNSTRTSFASWARTQVSSS